MYLIFSLLLLMTPLWAATPLSLSFDTAPNFFNIGPTQYATDDAGNAIAVWSVNNGQNVVLQFAYKPVGSDWQIPGDPRNPTQVISPFFFSVIDWTLAMDRQGNAVVVWRINNGTTIVVQAIYREAGSAKPFSPANDPLFQDNFLNYRFFNITTLPQVAIGDGKTTILWTVNNGFNTVIQASNGSGNVFSHPGNPTEANNILNYISFQPGQFNINTTPLLSVDKDGNAIVAWQIFNDSQLVVQAVTKIINNNIFGFEPPAGNPLQQNNILSPRLYSISSLQAVTIGNGNATVFWNRLDPLRGNNLILQAAFKPSGGLWQKPEEF